MRRASTSRPILPADWTEVLRRVQQTLEDADAAAARRIEALGVKAEDSSPPGFASELSPRLEQARQRADSLASYLDRAARAVAEADVALAAGEDAVRNWLQASEAGRRKLAEWVGRG